MVSHSGWLVVLTRGSLCGEFCELPLHLSTSHCNSQGGTLAETQEYKDLVRAALLCVEHIARASAMCFAFLILDVRRYCG